MYGCERHFLLLNKSLGLLANLRLKFLRLRTVDHKVVSTHVLPQRKYAGLRMRKDPP